MITIWLETNGGFVSYADIPPMRPLPATVIWGGRSFHLTDTIRAHASGSLHQVYREDIVVVVPDPTPRKDP